MRKQAPKAQLTIITSKCILRVNRQTHLRKSTNAFSGIVLALSNHLKDNKRSSGVGSLSPYCNQCLDLTRNVFEALTTIKNASWYCNHCVHAVPGVQKLLIRVCNVEEKCEALNKRMESLENKSCVSPDTVKDLVSEEVAELVKKMDHGHHGCY